MFGRRKRPIELDEESMSVKSKTLPMNRDRIFAPPKPPPPTREEIAIDHQRAINREQLDQRRTDRQMKTQQSAQQFRDKRDMNYLTFLQKQVASQSQQGQKQQQSLSRPAVPRPQYQQQGQRPQYPTMTRRPMPTQQRPMPQPSFNRFQYQPRWGGNQLGNVVRQPNYPRVDYLPPAPYRRF